MAGSARIKLVTISTEVQQPATGPRGVLDPWRRIPGMKQMDKYQRAVQLWPLLVFAARHQLLISYSTVEHLTGIPRVGVGGMLGIITRYCQKHELPWLTFIVIKEENGQPGEGRAPQVRKQVGSPHDSIQSFYLRLVQTACAKD